MQDPVVWSIDDEDDTMSAVANPDSTNPDSQRAWI